MRKIPVLVVGAGNAQPVPHPASFLYPFGTIKFGEYLLSTVLGHPDSASLQAALQVIAHFEVAFHFVKRGSSSVTVRPRNARRRVLFLELSWCFPAVPAQIAGKSPAGFLAVHPCQMDFP